MEKFEIDVNKLKIAGSEASVSKTIEELLELNKLLPKRSGKSAEGITQKQLDSKDYSGKEWRGEKKVVTENQFDRKENQEFEIVEIKIENASPENNGHNSKTWETNTEKINGHKDVPMLYQSLYNKENKK